MAQTTTSHLPVSLGPPRPSVSFISTAACSPSAFSVVTACIATPVCVHSPETVVGTAVTYDIYGLPVYVCTNATSGTSGGSETATSTSITTTSRAGIATASLQHTPLDSSSTSGSSTTTGTSSGTASSSPATTQSSNPARRNADLSSGLLALVLLSWLGIAVFNPGHL